jgi:hypothetical protein
MHYLIGDELNLRPQSYSLETSHLGRNLKDYHGFYLKLPEILRNSIKPVLTQRECCFEIPTTLFL